MSYLCTRNPANCGNSSVGRAQPCQGWGREFESRFPLNGRSSPNGLLFLLCKMKTRTKRPRVAPSRGWGVNIDREKLPTPWARVSFSAQRVQIKRDKVTKNLFETLFQRGFLIFGPIVQNPQRHKLQPQRRRK